MWHRIPWCVGWKRHALGAGAAPSRSRGHRSRSARCSKSTCSNRPSPRSSPRPRSPCDGRSRTSGIGWVWAAAAARGTGRNGMRVRKWATSADRTSTWREVEIRTRTFGSSCSTLLSTFPVRPASWSPRTSPIRRPRNREGPSGRRPWASSTTWPSVGWRVVRAVHVVFPTACRGRRPSGTWCRRTLAAFRSRGGDRSALLAAFQQDGHGILLGTSSFWEGVDVPGRPLRGLVIPETAVSSTDRAHHGGPSGSARGEGCECLLGVHGTAAAIRLKQGVGRLIRSRTDRGVVVLLDDRILRRRYGRAIRDSLPEMPLAKGPWHDVRRRVSAFYADDPLP